MKDLKIAGKPSTETEARELARVAFVAEYTFRIHRLTANVEPEPVLPRPRSPFRAPIATSPPLSSSPSSPSSPALRPA